MRLLLSLTINAPDVVLSQPIFILGEALGRQFDEFIAARYLFRPEFGR